MEELWILVVMLVVAIVILAAIILPIVALVISLRSKKLAVQVVKLQQTQPTDSEAFQQRRVRELAPLARGIQQLDARIDALEAALRAQSITVPETIAGAGKPAAAATSPPPAQEPLPQVETPPALPPSAVPGSPPETASVPIQLQSIQAERIESIIGRRLVGWAAVSLILLATAFFLKYVFDNRWIGELGRVAIGVASGVGLTLAGFRYHKRNWWIFSQILTAGGVVLLYISVYAAFGYYHLATQKAAFAYLAILVAETAGLALLYDAPAIAIMALVGGFLNPILLRSDRDQYRSLFAYITLLDIGALARLKHWKGLSSLAFVGSHLLFWLWYTGSYHPRKLTAVIVFQTVVFLLFLLAQLGRRLKRQPVTGEDLELLLINPFVFFATAYCLLNPDHHAWMGTFAIGMALLYAVSAKVLLDRSATSRIEVLVTISVAVTFVTLAIPIQLRANWITIAWAVEALTIVWVGRETKSTTLQAVAAGLFALALGKLTLFDTPLDYRPIFTPVLNKYFLSSLAVTACLFCAAALGQKLRAHEQPSARYFSRVSLLVALVTLWFVMSVETYTFFQARAEAQRLIANFSHERWLGQMAISVLWSCYAGTLAAVGFIRRSATVRWAALALFAVTIIKVMLVDIAQLEQFYRIIAFLVLGLLLLVVAWGYHRAFHSRESPR